MADHRSPLTARSPIKTWLEHPVGGPLLRGFFEQAGQDADRVGPIAAMPLQQLVELSGGQLPQELVDQLVRDANGGQLPAGSDDTADTGDGWSESITSGRFDGKTVIVTGAGSGIGRATASRIAREGGRVVAVDISGDRLEEFAGAHPDSDIVFVLADIKDSEQITKIVDAAGPRIDGLANVAGIMDDETPLHEVSDATWERVNVEGLVRLSRVVIPAMLDAGEGSIVNVTSEAGLRGSVAGVAYTASKHAVVGITRSSAFMYTNSGIRVNAVAPGAVATNIQVNFASQLGQERIGTAMQILPPMAQANQVAASITFLLSDDGTNIHGAILPSDGGWSAV